MNCVIGYIQYFNCVNLVHDPQGIADGCFRSGPGADLQYLYDIITYLI